VNAYKGEALKAFDYVNKYLKGTSNNDDFVVGYPAAVA
jgi:hypothetical protein